MLYNEVMNLADKVKKKRIELGFSQDELAKKMGYTSRSSINKIEKGREVSDKIVHKLADALDVSFSYLMGFEEKPAVRGIEVLGTLQRVETNIKADFCLYMNDFSMKEAGILKNDLVFFVKKKQYKANSIVCIQFEGDRLIRRFHEYGNVWVFRDARDPGHEIVCAKEEIEILGQACALERKLG